MPAHNFILLKSFEHIDMFKRQMTPFSASPKRGMEITLILILTFSRTFFHSSIVPNFISSDHFKLLTNSKIGFMQKFDQMAFFSLLQDNNCLTVQFSPEIGNISNLPGSLATSFMKHFLQTGRYFSRCLSRAVINLAEDDQSLFHFLANDESQVCTNLSEFHFFGSTGKQRTQSLSTDAFQQNFVKFSNLQVVDLARFKSLTDECLMNCFHPNLKNTLSELSLPGSSPAIMFSGKGLAVLSNFHKLRKLSISDCSTVDPENLVYLAPLLRLEELELIGLNHHGNNSNATAQKNTAGGGGSGAQLISKMAPLFSSDSYLQTLELFKCDILDDEMLFALCASLKGNPFFRSLSIRLCMKITREGLMEAIGSNFSSSSSSSLKLLSVSRLQCSLDMKTELMEKCKDLVVEI